MTVSAVVPLSVKENCLTVAEEGDSVGVATSSRSNLLHESKSNACACAVCRAGRRKRFWFPLYRRPAYFITCSENWGYHREMDGRYTRLMKLRAMQLRRNAHARIGIARIDVLVIPCSTMFRSSIQMREDSAEYAEGVISRAFFCLTIPNY